MTKNVNIVITADSSEIAKAVTSANNQLGRLSKGTQRSLGAVAKQGDMLGSVIGGSVAGSVHHMGEHMNTAGKQMGNAGKQMNGLNIRAVALGTAITALALNAFGSLSANVDRAIVRLDTMNNFPRVMANLGIGAEQAEASISRLSDRLTGLPTTLDEAALSVQRLTSVNQNIEGSTELFLAMNNAIIAGGASAAMQSTALEQMTQAYSKGKPDMVEWRNMMMSMPAQLRQVAQAMDFASTQELGEALSEGTVTMNDFMRKIMELNREGVNGFGSFEEQARAATGGVQTSMMNLQTAIVRGITTIMQEIGQSNIAGFFSGIANAVNAVIPYIVALMRVVGTAVGYITSAFGTIFGTSANQSKAVADNTAKASKALAGAGAGAGAVADGLGSAAGSAKELNKQLAGFDEMNVLTETSSGGSGGGGGAGAGNFDIPSFEDPTAETQKGMSKLDSLMKRLMNNPFVKGFLFVFEAIGEAIKGVVWFVGKIAEAVREFMPQPVIDFFNAISENEVVKGILEAVAFAVGILAGALTVGLIAWGLWNAIVLIATGVTAAFSAVMGFLLSPIILVVAAIAAVIAIVVLLIKNWDTVKEVALNVWNFIKDVWGVVAGWFGGQIQEIKDFFTGLWDGIVALFSGVGDWFKDRFNEAKEGIKNAFGSIGQWFKDKWNDITNAFSSVKTWFGDMFAGAWQRVKDAFANVRTFFSDIWNKIKGVFGDVGNAIGNAVGGGFKGIVNGVISVAENAVNRFIDNINGAVNVINKLPGVSIGKISRLAIPRLARGGVVERATLAMVGEAGAEAVVPLENNTGWIDKIASMLGSAGVGGAPSQIIVKIGEETIIDTVIDGINDKSELSGQNVITVH